MLPQQHPAAGCGFCPATTARFVADSVATAPSTSPRPI